MFWKKKEDKLVAGSEEGNILNQSEDQALENNSEVLGMAFKEAVPEETLQTNDVGDFATSTIGAMSMTVQSPKEGISKREVIVTVGSKWQHFKGSIVNVKAIAVHTETLEKLVIYENNNELWARPYDNFISDEDVSQRKDNKTGQKYRFEEIKE